MKSEDDIQALQVAIKKLHKCNSAHEDSVPFEERNQNGLVWSGTVEVFALENHPKASRCFAWAHRSQTDEHNARYITVLELPPVNSPQQAVQAFIANEAKKDTRPLAI